MRNQVTKQISITKFEYHKDKLSRCVDDSKDNEIIKGYY